MKDKLAVLIDGSNLYSSTKELGIELDFAKFLPYVKEQGDLLRCYYFTAVVDDQHNTVVKPLLDYLTYNGYTIITKQAKEYRTQSGAKRVKGNMDIEICVTALKIAPHVGRIILVTGDGDFRYLVQELQGQGIHVTAISTLETSPPMMSDDLRRQVDVFIDLTDIQELISR